MTTTYQEKEAFTQELGKALKQTFEDVITLRKELEGSKKEICLLKMVQETLSEENVILRDRNEGFEESLVESKQKHTSTLQEFKEVAKQENMRVAKVLRRTLQAFKRSKNALDKLYIEYDILKSNYIKKSNYINELHHIINESQKDLNHLHESHIKLLDHVLSPASPDAEQKIIRLEDSLKALKEKAKIAILQKEEELKKQKLANQELQVKLKEKESINEHLLKEEEVTKNKLNQVAKKMEDDQLVKQRLLDQVQLLKQELEALNRNHQALAESHKTLKSDFDQLQENYLSSQTMLEQKDTELNAMHLMKAEYERMHTVFSSIQACMGGQMPVTPKKPEMPTDLFELPKSKNPSMQQELF
jgi:hypothetical protein